MRQPSRRELMLEMGRLDRAARRRIRRLAGKGEVASSQREALLVAAIARRGLKAAPWAIAAAIALALLVGISGVFQIGRYGWLAPAWMDILVVVLALTNASFIALWHVPRLRRAERLNLAVAEGAEVDPEKGLGRA